MSPQSYEFQVLEKADYRKQHIQQYRDVLPPLGDSSIRVQPCIVALTTNNITYARLGDAPGLNWFAAHPLPSKEGPYSDSTQYGRVSAWGTGKVIESTADFINVGSFVWGYLPLASLPVDKRVQKTIKDNVFLETTDYRQNLMPVYNRYFILDNEKGESERYNAYAALTRVLFETSYSLNRMAFGWNSDVPMVNPLGLSPPPQLDTWTKDRASLRNSAVVIMPASSKTAFTFAYALRHLRPETEQPRAIIGASSGASRPFCEATGLFDRIAEYEIANGDAATLVSSLDIGAAAKVLLLDFGAREGLKDTWLTKLETITDNFTFIRVGSAIPEKDKPESTEERMKAFLNPGANQYPSNASTLRDAGMKFYGEAEYLGDLTQEFDRFLESDCISALKLVWGKGLTGPGGLEGGWDHIVSGKMGAAEGLVYRLV